MFGAEAYLLKEGKDLGLDELVSLFVPVDQIELIDCYNDLGDSEAACEDGMLACTSISESPFEF